ncbi:MAG: hypothetical protein H8E62_03345 [Planctomycetes bacterium]|nr:hypothetical protein [Planctomycetota bacterium]
MKHKTARVFVLLGIMVLTGSMSYADRRGYVWTYEYQTMPQGTSEVEYYLTHKISDFHKQKNKNTWDHYVEYEYGLTDHWDVAVYQTWRQTNTKTDDKFEYNGSKFRTRYRIGEKGQFPIDLLLYAEYILPDGSDGAEKFEGKLIFAKDIGKWNVAYNQIYEKEVKNGHEFEHGYAAGVNYEFSPTWKLGIESTGNYTEEKYYLGPTVSWASQNYWVNFGALRGLNDRSDDLQFRMIIGIPF